MTMQYFEFYYKNKCYTLNEVTNEGAIYTRYFLNLDEAKEYGKKTDEHSTVYIFENKCVKVYDSVDDIHHSSHSEDEDQTYYPEYDFSNMTFETYGRGYLLKPPTDSDYWGNKYFHNGWWISSQEGWFFKSYCHQWLIDNGAQFVDDELEEGELEVELNDSETDFDMTVKTYGKGFLVKPDEGHKDWGKKYYHNGWWMPKHNGWFFKKQDYLTMIESGSIMEKEHTTADVGTSTSVDFSGMGIVPHGKGYLLKPHCDHSDYGIKYYHNGFWMPRHKSWFFKAEHYDFLLDSGAVDIIEVDSDSDDEYVDSVSLDGMTFTEYGRGYMLYCLETNEHYGSKYLLTGFWNNKCNGWFFKSKDFDTLIKHGAKYIKQEEESEEDVNTLTSSITNEDFEYLTNESSVSEMPIFTRLLNGKGWKLKNNFDKMKEFKGGRWMGNSYFMTTKEKNSFMNQFFDI